MICFFRWDFEMPSILEGSILIMAKAGSGVAMFSMGTYLVNINTTNFYLISLLSNLE